MITFIGNNANQEVVTDGGRLKMRLFISLLKKEGYQVNIIELDGWKKRFLKIVLQIKKAIKRNDSLIIMAGPKGCRFIIPLVCFFNKKRKSRVVFCPVGIGTIDKLVKGLSHEQLVSFINSKEFYGIHDHIMRKHLMKLDYVCPENEIQNTLYKTFYGLSNTCVIENFRDDAIEPRKNNFSKHSLRIIYASRVKEYKGILDLIEVINKINLNTQHRVFLDIFGDNQLSPANVGVFNSGLNEYVRYCGATSSNVIKEKLPLYDLFCLPTRYYGEGTSGALVESMIAGTPSLVSSYSQVNTLILDKKTGFIFNLGSKEDLERKLLYILENKSDLYKISVAVQESAKRFTYAYNRSTFLKVMTGVNK